jgi:Tfp pilus assembly ATPase PilU
MHEDVILPLFPMRDSLLRVMIDNKGSDFYYTVGTFPGIKVSGEIVMIDQ